MALLYDEFFNVGNSHTQNIDRLTQPFLSNVGALLGDFWNKLFNAVEESLRRRLELTLDSFAVKLQKTDIRARGQVQLEVSLIKLEQLHHISEVLNRVLQALIH